MHMELNDAVQLMTHTNGYSLWVGAGVSIQLASAGGRSVPGWAKLCESLEEIATIRGTRGDYPSRLDDCLRILGRDRFQREVRGALLHSLCDAVFVAARAHKDLDDCVPKAMKQLAALGALANPIVNFNIETLTSTALAHAGGPFDLRTFTPPLDDLKDLPHSSGGGSFDGKRFPRTVYHIHGALEAGGICVLSKSEYDSMNGTLALQLAVHAAFASRLFIVGMSLEDAYLRMQLEQFMPQLHGVFWFVDASVRSELLEWAVKARITTVHIDSWNDFWSVIEAKLPAPSALEGVLTWLSILSAATVSRSPRARAWVLDGFRKLEATEPELNRWRRVAALAGVSNEPIDEVAADAFEAEMRELQLPLLKAVHKLV